MRSDTVFAAGLALAVVIAGPAATAALAMRSPAVAAPAPAAAPASAELAIVPASFTLVAGEGLELAVTGSPVLPLFWDTTDHAVLSVSSSGTVTAVAPGHARVMVADSAGASAISAICTVAHLSLAPAPLSVRNSQAPFVVAVRGDLAAWTVHSVELTLTFDPARIEAVGATSEGSLSATWGEPTVALAEDHIRVVHAGAAALSGSGSLVGIVLRLRPGAVSGDAIDLSLGDVRLNEGMPIARGLTGVVHVYGAPVTVRSVTVDPLTAELRPNSLLRFTATVAGNGVGGVAWSVLGGATQGTIDAGGLYRAPATPPAPPYATIVATSLEDPSAGGSAEVDLLPEQAAGLVTLVALRNPANSRVLTLLVAAADAFVQPPALTMDGQAVALIAVDGSAAVYRGHVCLPQTATGATFHAQGSTDQGSGEADLAVTF
jgi:hypothetical protein